MEVLGPKGPARHGGIELLEWARRQLAVASDILDNPGGGLLFATQTMGQVRAALAEEGGERWTAVTEALVRAEDHAVRREFERARALLGQASSALAS